MANGPITPGVSRAVWFVGLWAASALTTALIAYALRWVLLG